MYTYRIHLQQGIGNVLKYRSLYEIAVLTLNLDSETTRHKGRDLYHVFQKGSTPLRTAILYDISLRCFV